MTVNLIDVAKEAEVSISTVSRVIRGTNYVDDQTRSKVLEVIDRLHYQPNHFARGLKYGRTYTIGFIVHDIANPFFSHAVKGAEQLLRSDENNGMELILYNTNGQVKRELKALELMIDKRVEGVILASTSSKECVELAHKMVTEHKIPLVSIDNQLGGFEKGVVSVDNHQGTYLLTSHLIQHGYPSIGFIAGSSNESHAQDRLEGYRHALAEHGITPDPDHIVSGNWLPEDGYRATIHWIETNKLPKAVLSSNNFMCMGVLSALKERNLSVPDDIAVASFDDIEFGSLFHPGMTTLNYSWNKIGEESVRLLMMKKDEEKKNQKPRYVKIPIELEIRESCGCKVKP
jgi:LacI family transcriptional regulator